MEEIRRSLILPTNVLVPTGTAFVAYNMLSLYIGQYYISPLLEQGLVSPYLCIFIIVEFIAYMLLVIRSTDDQVVEVIRLGVNFYRRIGPDLICFTPYCCELLMVLLVSSQKYISFLLWLWLNIKTLSILFMGVPFIYNLLVMYDNTLFGPQDALLLPAESPDYCRSSDRKKPTSETS